MGRYVRAVLRDLAERPAIDLTLLVREPQAAAAYRAIAGKRVAVGPLAAARSKRAFDRVWYPWNGIRFAAAAPALVTINDDFAFAYPARGFIARRREQGPIRRALRRAARFATISTWSRDVLAARFGIASERFTVLPLAPDPFFTPGYEPSPIDETFVLAVGTGEARKNVAFLIAAMERAFESGEVALVLVGETDADLARRLRDVRIPVRMLPRVDDTALRQLYRTAAVVAVPSLAEGFGLVAAEAQACGAAVLAANTSALPEAVGEAGITADPNDVGAWSSALQRLLSNPSLRADYGARGAARWAGASVRSTTDALLAALELSGDNGM
jgi:glycosyltransferase involved in cell wall biosynthesis